jgi:hypothetical protein
MWEDSNYCWVVLCKNTWFHFRQSLFSSHRIPLGETDAVMSPPALDGPFQVRCDECGKEYLYKPSELRRYEQELPESFTPHPLFQPGGDRRRSKRWPAQVGLVVRGESRERGVFQEETITLSINAHGALMVLAASVPVGQTLFLKNPRTQKELEVRVVRSGAPRTGMAEVGVEFVQPAPEFWPAESKSGDKGHSSMGRS